jgi:hypothetical protein
VLDDVSVTGSEELPLEEPHAVVPSIRRSEPAATAAT